jgi:hypothetical protein
MAPLLACTGTGGQLEELGDGTTTETGGDGDGDGDGDCATWCPTPGTTWQWQLSGTLDTEVDVEMFDIDLFDTPNTTIAALHDAGRVVI